MNVCILQLEKAQGILKYEAIITIGTLDELFNWISNAYIWVIYWGTHSLLVFISLICLLSFISSCPCTGDLCLFIILLDLSAPFDMISHNVLLQSIRNVIGLQELHYTVFLMHFCSFELGVFLRYTLTYDVWLGSLHMRLLEMLLGTWTYSYADDTRLYPWIQMKLVVRLRLLSSDHHLSILGILCLVM